MNPTKEETYYILKHEMGYVTVPMPDALFSIYQYFTEDPMKATRFTTSFIAEKAIERNKSITRDSIRSGSELLLVDVISQSEVKKLKIKTTFEVED